MNPMQKDAYPPKAGKMKDAFTKHLMLIKKKAAAKKGK